MLPQRKRHFAAWMLALVCAVQPPARGELTLAPDFSPAMYFDDNRRLRPDGGPSVVGFVNSMGFESVYSRPTYSVTLAPLVRVSRHTAQTEFDAEDYFVDLSAVKIFDRHQFSGALVYERENSGSTELTDSGRVDIAVPRTTLGGNAAWGHEITDTLTMSLFGSYRDISFAGGDQTALTDYISASFGTSFEYAQSEATSLLMTASASRFDTPESDILTVLGVGSSDGVTDSFALQVGFEHSFSETLQARFTVGQNISKFKTETTRPTLVSFVPFRIENQTVTETGTNGGLILDTSVRRQIRNGLISASWSRFFSGSSQGARFEREEVIGEARYRWSPRWITRARFVYRDQQQETADDILVRPLQFYNLIGSIEYVFDPEWKLQFYYRFRQQERPDIATIASSHRLGLTLIYNGDGHLFSF